MSSNQASFFDLLLTGNKLGLVVEVWLSRLRDILGKDFHPWFWFDLTKSTIHFEHPEMIYLERQEFALALSAILAEHKCLWVKRLDEIPSLLDESVWHPFRKGAKLIFHVQYPERLVELTPDNPGLTQTLQNYAHRVSQQFHRSAFSSDQPHPLTFEIIPLSCLPGFWLSLKPTDGRSYPTLGGKFKGQLLEELKDIQQDLGDPRFSLAAIIETDRVWLLLDFKETHKENRA